ncbi:MAG: glutathione S-transferase family protein [Deltaproteobacteria bacterium]|nr:MAG: glutathione S-transferase family protein [Deltaproteobacteria bacterium]
MIDLYSYPTPNGKKVSVALEELELPYRAHLVDIQRGAQFEPDFLAISPNNKIPAIVDSEGPDGAPLALFESGAILLYLAEKAGRLLPTSARERHEAVAWLMFQMGGVGPMFGQRSHFTSYAPERIPYAIERYTNEAHRLLGVMDRRLDGREWLAGQDYSVADIASYCWVSGHSARTDSPERWPHVQAWVDRIGARPAVGRGMKVLAAEAAASA